VVPLYLDDAVQASVGWPLPNGRAWCRVLEFAEEFQITASFQPFALGERRGG
jgi:hypothetical protein